MAQLFSLGTLAVLISPGFFAGECRGDFGVRFLAGDFGVRFFAAEDFGGLESNGDAEDFGFLNFDAEDFRKFERRTARANPERRAMAALGIIRKFLSRVVGCRKQIPCA